MQCFILILCPFNVSQKGNDLQKYNEILENKNKNLMERN